MKPPFGALWPVGVTVGIAPSNAIVFQIPFPETVPSGAMTDCVLLRVQIRSVEKGVRCGVLRGLLGRDVIGTTEYVSLRGDNHPDHHPVAYYLKGSMGAGNDPGWVSLGATLC